MNEFPAGDSGFASLLQGIFQRKQSMDGCVRDIFDGESYTC